MKNKLACIEHHEFRVQALLTACVVRAMPGRCCIVGMWTGPVLLQCCTAVHYTVNFTEAHAWQCAPLHLQTKTQPAGGLTGLGAGLGTGLGSASTITAQAAARRAQLLSPKQ